MGIPDNTYFGSGLTGSGINYGEVRKLSTHEDKIKVLEGRLDALFFNEVKSISKRDENGKPDVYAPFSTCVLTLLGIETLGHIIDDPEKVKKKHKNEYSKIISRPIYLLIDKKLLKTPTKPFKKAFINLHGQNALGGISTYSDIFHKYQRNTFQHGFQAKGVFLEHTQNELWELREDEGFMVVNPYLF
jgi:hypothetical protein